MAKQLTERDKTSIATKLCYGIGSFGVNEVNVLCSTFLLSYYTDTVHIGMAAISTMMFLVRIPDGITDLIMGAVVDKTDTRMGKCRPWLLLSAPLMAIGLILLFNVPGGFSEAGKLVYAYLTYIFLTCIVVTINGLSNASLLARLTLNMNDRTTIVTVQGLFTTASQMIIGVSVVPVVAKVGWGAAATIFGLLAGALILVGFFGTKERVGVDAETGKLRHKEPPLKNAIAAVLRNKYFWILLFLSAITLVVNASTIAASIFYVNIIIGDPGFMSVLMGVGQVPGFLLLVLMPVIAPKISKRWFMALGCALAIIGFFVLSLANGSKSLVLAGSVLRTLGFGPIFAGVYAFVADVVDYGEWKTGLRTEGLMSATSSVGSKVGIGIGSALTGWVLAAGGYVGGESAQSASTRAAINFAFSWLGVILGAVLLLLILTLNVEKYMPQVRASLEQKYASGDTQGK